jgi:hypothetical protein
VVSEELKYGLVGLLEDCKKDWVIFAEEVLGAYLDDEQKAVLRSVQVNSKTSVKSGTARGKDFVAAVAALCFLYLTPGFDDKGNLIDNTKVALTAPTDRQVKNIMMPEISRLYNRMIQNGFGFMAGRLNAYDIKTDYKEWFLTGFKADENKHEAWSGFHAVNTCFIVTEASGIAETIFNAIEGNLQGYSRLLLVFNDNNGTGYAAASQKKPGWAKFRLDSLNAPNILQKRIVIPGQVDWSWVNDRVRDWCQTIPADQYDEVEGDFFWENDIGRHCYRPNDLFRVKVRGMAPKVSSGVLIPPEWIEIANDRWREFKQQGFKTDRPLRIGNDVAGMGRDNSSFCHRYGRFVSHFDMIFSGGTANHMEVVGKAKNLILANTDVFRGVYAQIFIDTIGEGAGVYSRLIELCSERDSKLKKECVHSVKFSESAEHNGQELKDATGQYSFLNMRAYLYWAARDWLDPKNKQNACLPPDDELFQELTETKWKFRSDGSIQIEPKEEIQKRIKRSPDKADAFVNTFYPVKDFDPTPVKRKDLSKYFS